ncbi:MAG: Gfo/Idh/MocA family oxidoreductase [Bulleidia sp.]
MNSVLLIGAGRHASANLYPVISEQGWQVEGICTRSAEHSEAALKKFGFSGRPYDRIDQMLAAESASKVIISLPASAAVSAVTACLNAGREVFCEKPCGMNLEEAELVDHAQTVHGLQTGFMKRYAPVYRKMKENIPRIGGTLSFSGYFSVDASAFCRDDRDYIYFVAIHYLDLIRYLFGETAQVSALACRNGEGTSYHLLLGMESGAAGTLTLENRKAWTREAEGITVTCPHGFISSENLSHLRVHHETSENSWKDLCETDQLFSVTENPASGSMRDLYLRGFAGELQSFMSAPVPVNHENLETTELCEKVLNALGSGQPE